MIGNCILAANLQDLTNESNVAAIIGWVPQKNDKYLCGGYYRELPIPYSPNPYTISQVGNYDINADKSQLSFKGTSILTGNVSVTQPNQRMKSEKAYIYRNKLGKIDLLKMYGHVSYDTPGQLIAAHNATMLLSKNRVVLNNAAYRVALAHKEVVTTENPQTKKPEKHIYDLNFWGTAKKITQTKPKHYVLKDAKYTTCSPSCHTWNMHSSTVTLDKKTEKGSAWNTVLYWKKVPVFYLPYISFPLSKKRKSGFLFPLYGNSTNGGLLISIPFYWNIAPNYDALFTTSYYGKRGVMETILPRYLTEKNSGKFKFSFLPDDRAFKNFKNTSANNDAFRANTPRALDTLENDSDNRYQIHWKDKSQFSAHTSATVDYTRVSDSYYSQDFGNQFILNDNNNQLLQKADLEYQGENWGLYGLVQGYQTLHPVNEVQVYNQYQRLPELQANGDYPQVWHDLDVSLSTQIVHFSQSRTPDSQYIAPVTGDRLHVDPAIEYPFVSSYGYLTPKIQFNYTKYQSSQIGYLQHRSSNLAVPIFDVHGGLTFERNFSFFKSKFIQTLEPEFYYLYVPYQNQNDLPIFDTYTQQFTYPVMFEDNRFSGFDRIGDANQMTLAVSSRFIDANTGAQRAIFSIGDIVYFRNRNVQLWNLNTPYSNTPSTDTLTPYDERRFSPIAGQATYNISKYWSGTVATTWSPYRHHFDYENASLAYRKDQSHLLNINYSLVSNSDNGLDGLKSAGTTGYWLIHHRWSVMGGWNHQWGTVNGNTYLAGLGYTSCCWGLRFAVLRTIDRLANNNKFQYNTTYYVQFVLKGLGGAGLSNISNELESYISGYEDHFTGVS